MAFLLCLENELFFEEVTTSHILDRLTELQVRRLFMEKVRAPQSVARLPAGFPFRVEMEKIVEDSVK